MAELTVLAPREVPLGGLRALSVRRTLPHRDRSFVGAWCFVDHYGPAVLDRDGGMDVPPHPHTGLQTVSWLFAGEIEHRDSGGVVGIVRPGEVNLMTAGRGIAHSEVSVDPAGASSPGASSSGAAPSQAGPVLHGVQLWVALPREARDADRGFEHHAPAVVPLSAPAGGGPVTAAAGHDGSRPDVGAIVGTARVFIGALTGVDASPVHTFTPLLGAQLDLEPDASVELAVDPAYEHAVLLDRGAIGVDGTALSCGDLACREPGRDRLTLRAGPAGARVILLGGVPFEEEIVMWWNFVGRSHEEIVAFREAWQGGSAQFGDVPGYVGPVLRIPAPELPHVRLRPRSRIRRR